MSRISHSGTGPTSLFPFGGDGPVERIEAGRTTSAISDTPIESSVHTDAGHTGYLGLSVGPKALAATGTIAVLLLSALALRTGQLQIAHGAEYLERAEGNRSRIEWIPSERGIIYDRNGVPLVRNIPTFTATITPADLPKDIDVRRHVLASVAETLAVTPVDIEAEMGRYGAASAQPVTVADDVSHEQAVRLRVLGKEWPAISIRTGIRREYPYAASAASLSHLLGYEGRIAPEELDARRAEGYQPTDLVGKAGLERWYESALRGAPGRRRIEVDARGLEKTLIAEEPGKGGTNLVLALDLDLQEAAQRILNDTLRRIGKRRASVIVLRPDTGEVLAMVNAPQFDNNLFSAGISSEAYAALAEDPDHPLFDRTVSASIASGSTFKPVVAAAALEEGIVTPRTAFLSTGGVRIGEWFFPDWKYGGHGMTNVAKALSESVNTFFYIVGGGDEEHEGLGIDRIIAYAERFGFGSVLGIDLPGEGAGFLPTKAWKEETKGERWYVGDTYHAAIGQGDILVTPLQIAAMTAAFANGGALVVPHVVTALTNADGSRTEIAPTVLDPQVVSPATVEEVRRGMRMAVTDGSARSLSLLPVSAAGKTGTAQWSSTKDTHAWFTSFAPYEDPELVITVLVEEGGEGSVAAAPIARDIYQWYFGGRR